MQISHKSKSLGYCQFYPLIMFTIYNKLIQSNKLIPAKGQLILKCPFGVFKSPKKPNEIFSRISALASKKRSNQKNCSDISLFE